MSKSSLRRLVDQIKALSPGDQRSIREMLGTPLPVPPSPPTEDDFERELVELGVLSYRPLSAPPASSVRPKPIEVHGPPLSEVIVQERR